MARRQQVDHRDYEGLQVNAPSREQDAPEALQPHQELQYTQSTRDGRHKEGYTYNESRRYFRGADEVHSSGERRYCGLRRVTAMLLALVMLLVVLVVVLGATLGTLLNRSSSSSSSLSSSSSSTTGSPLSVQSYTGIAVTASTAYKGQTYAYYQDGSNNIIECEISGEDWQSTSGSKAQGGVVTGKAKQGSPLAAVAGTFKGQDLRVLFFIDGNDNLAMTNRTISGAWSSPHIVLDDAEATFAADTIALDTIIAPNYDGFNDIRVYYGSSDDGIREIGWGHYPPEPGHYWSGIAHDPFFFGSDPNTGIGATSSTERSFNVYLRNETTGFVNQWNWNYGRLTVTPEWLEVTSTGSNDIKPGSDITACPDPKTGIDYIFYQNRSGNLVMRTSYTVPVSSTKFSDYHVLEVSPAENSKLSARCEGITSSKGPVVYYQETSSVAQLSYAHVAINGSILSKGIVKS